jgi:hypothetical protein
MSCGEERVDACLLQRLFLGDDLTRLLVALCPIRILFRTQALTLLLIMHRVECEAFFAEVGPTFIGERHDLLRRREQRMHAIRMTQAEARLAQRGAHATVPGDHFKDVVVRLAIALDADARLAISRAEQVATRDRFSLPPHVPLHCVRRRRSGRKGFRL